jgi:hypothetical protein
MALANVVWPALAVGGRLLTVPAIAVGLALEISALHYFLRIPWRRSLIAGLTMNVASTVLGIVLVPLSGIAWEFFPGSILYKIFSVGTFNPGTWAATFVLAALTNALVEAAVLRFAFHFDFTRRLFGILAAANCASVAAAYVSIWLDPPAF